MPTLPPPSLRQAPWQARHAFWLLVLSLLLTGLPNVVLASIYSCPTNDGGTIFQDRPCPEKTVDKDVPRNTQAIPFGIHPSWFERPDQAEGRAFCDRRRCECGQQEREHGDMLAQAVADALYMDGGWYRFETSYRLWRNEPATSSNNAALRMQAQEAACNVMMSQQLLRDFAITVSSKLRREALKAEELGFDKPEPCYAGVENACNYLDSVQLYQRLQEDAKALQFTREGIADEF